ncbi:MAG: glycosyltransferase [Kordiimonadaceae bacterium]|nr:glycosyltransferase [Kordiimonadaceae bacterium]
MQVLVTSPIPTHPQNHGNRARVYSLCRTLQQRGYKVHFVYGGLEGVSPEQELAMRATWDHVYIVPYEQKRRKQSKRTHHLIDDWYVPAVTEITQRILKVWDIDYCLANYVWFSRWLLDVPAGIPKYLDTHDMFANRNKNMKKDGLSAKWYSTTPAEEAKALNRADVVLAIQSSEAAVFQKITKTQVATLGHYIPPNFLSAPDATPYSAPDKKHGPSNNRKLKVGYLASNNPINQHSLHKLVQELPHHPHLLDTVSLHLAGAICGCDVAQDSPFEKRGFVDKLETFYEEMDIILNPNLGGTGLKIKSVEALSYGKPLVATYDAMIGIETSEKDHLHKTLNSLLEGLSDLAGNPSAVEALGLNGRVVFTRYSSAQKHTLDALFPIKNTAAPMLDDIA